MDIQIVQGSIQESRADTLIVNLLEGIRTPTGATGAVDQASGGAIGELIENGDLNGELGKVGVVYPRGAIPAKRVLVTGLGENENFRLDTVRRASGAAMKLALDLNAKEIATVVHGAGVGGLEIADAAQATIEGSLLAYYRYDAPKQKEKPLPEIQSLSVVEFDPGKLGAIKSGVEAAQAIARGVFLARDLVNMPPNVATPTRMAAAAGEIAEAYKMTLTVGDREWAAHRKMGAFLAVAQGAEEEPKFIVLEHNGEREDLDTVVLVGKGITFDSGGISLKPSERMGTMKSDMAGAAAVLGAMKAVGALGLPLRVVGITPCTENKPDGRAYLPADVITASNGKTIEIISTDAEGRMVLADGLVYAANYSPKAVIDLATLTGACVTALGQGVAAGLFSNDDALRDRLIASGNKVQERLWHMPLFDDYRKTIDSQVADIKNSGGRFGGVGTSAIFLKEFTDYNWAHVDMAGMALTEKGNEYMAAGATGFGVRLLVDFLRNW
jgi:leucyl aminopeptidase